MDLSWNWGKMSQECYLEYLQTVSLDSDGLTRLTSFTAGLSFLNSVCPILRLRDFATKNFLNKCWVALTGAQCICPVYVVQTHDRWFKESGFCKNVTSVGWHSWWVVCVGGELLYRLLGYARIYPWEGAGWHPGTARMGTTGPVGPGCATWVQLSFPKWKLTSDSARCLTKPVLMSELYRLGLKPLLKIEYFRRNHRFWGWNA